MTVHALRLLMSLACFGLLAAWLPALAQTQRPATPAQPVVDPAYEAAQKTFDALPEAERKAIQNDLIWASDFTATVSGGFGKRTYDALLAFERAARQKPDGILEPAERKLLTETATQARNAAKFTMVTDPRTGAALGLPLAALRPAAGPGPGSLWASADGSVTVETAVAAGGAADLPAAFDRVMAIQAPGRKVTYKLLRPDFFVVAGETGPMSFYTRYGIGKSHLAGYTLRYPTARSKQLERTVIALANTFQPIAGAPPAQQAAVTPTPGQTAAPQTQQASDSLAAGLVQTGLVIGPGKVVTPIAIEACPEITIRRTPARIVTTDKASGLALIEATGILGTTLPIATGQAAGEAVVLGQIAAPGGATLAASGAQWIGGGASGRIEAPITREGSGSVIFSRTGQITGMIVVDPRKVRQVAGIVPSTSHAVIPSETIARLSGIAPGQPSSPAAFSAGALVGRFGPAIVPVECSRIFAMPRN